MCISSTAIIELNSIIKITLSDGIECYVLLAIIIKLLIIIFRVHVYVSHMRCSLNAFSIFFSSALMLCDFPENGINLKIMINILLHMRV